MGILNVTPDSFSDGGRYLDAAAAIAHALALVAEGADIIDVGGESTRPGAEAVDEAEELRRVVPVIEAIAGAVRVSIDTTKPAVARAAVAAGATLINDVSASLEEVAAETGVGWVAMHRQGLPATMQLTPHYDDVVAEVSTFLVERAERATAAGVSEVWVDPGIGFGKTSAHNLALLRHLDALAALGWPVAIGTSRKQFLGRIMAVSDAAVDAATDHERVIVPTTADDRLEGSVATAVWAVAQGARMVRVHDVLATARAMKVVAA